MPTTIHGQIGRITFNNEENGFSILKLKIRGHRELIKAVESFMAPTAGQVDDNEITFYRGAVISPEVGFQGFTYANGVGENHVNFIFDCNFNRCMRFQRFNKVIAEYGLHQKTSSY